LNMKKLIITGLFSILFTWSFAQQDPQFSQNMYNRLYNNPGVAGSNNAICATLLYRQQWITFDGNPETFLLSVHSPFRLFNMSWGGGLNIVKDGLGNENTLFVKGSLAYRMALGTGNLGVGLTLGMLQKKIGSNWVSIDPFAQDAAIPDNGAGKTGFDMDFGVYYKTDKLYLGLSALHLPSGTLSDSYSASSTPGAVPVDFNYKIARHYYIMAGYDYDLPIDMPLTLQPSVFVKSDAASTQVDVNVNLLYNNMVWVGVSYRMQDALVPMIGFMKDGIADGVLKIGVSYDVTTSILRQYSNGSIEVMASYCFNLPDKTIVKKHKTVRFL